MKQFGEYALKEKIGEGGYAQVFMARGADGRKVAVKLLKESMQRRPHVLKDFLWEGRVLGQFCHENIIEYLGAEQHDGRYGIITEYFESMTFKEVLLKNQSLPDCLTLLQQVGLGLAYMHRIGFVHLDIKPGNVLVNESKAVKLIDFSLARKASFFSMMFRKLSRRSIPGSPAYMAPEVIRGDTPTAQSDLYSLGVLTYLAVTGQLPFEGGTVTDLLNKQTKAIPTAPTVLNPGLPESLEVLIFKLLAKKPGDRPASAEHFCLKLIDIARQLQKVA